MKETKTNFHPLPPLAPSTIKISLKNKIKAHPSPLNNQEIN